MSVGCNAEERRKSYFWKRSIIVDSCELMFSQFKNKCKVNMVLSYYHKKYVLFFDSIKTYYHNIWFNQKFDQWNIKSYNSKCKISPFDFHFLIWINHQALYFSIFSLSLKNFFRITSRSTIFYIGKITNDEDDDDDLFFAFE